MSLNGDINNIWQDDDNGGNGNNNVYIRGSKVVGCELTGNRNEILNAFDIPGALRANSFVVWVPSLSLPSSLAGTLSLNGVTITPNVAIDPNLVLFSLLAGIFQPTLGQESVSLNPVINFATVLGQPVTWTAVVLDGNGDLTRFYSDPVIQNP